MQAGVSVPHYQGVAGELQPLPVLIITSVALLVTGVVMISSASMDMAAATLGNSYHYVIRQILFAGLGCATAPWHAPPGRVVPRGAALYAWLCQADLASF